MSNEKSQTELLSEISEKLDIVLGYLAVRGIEGDAAAIVDKLHKLGLSAKTIAPVAGLTENAVNIRLTRMKKRRTAS